MKINRSEKFIFWNSILFGICGGVIGNILVNACYALLLGSCTNQICIVGNISAFAISSIVFICLIIFILNKLNKTLK